MMSARPRVLYVQYTNPAAYPPLEHSARLLADNGCEVLLLGTVAPGDSLTMSRHEGVRVELLPFVAPGWRQKIHYLRFAAWAQAQCRDFRPDWIYASDPLSCPVTLSLAATTPARLLYHEHDGPAEDPRASWFMRTVLAARRKMAARVELCVLPNERRAEQFQRAHPFARVTTVWNCPTRHEINHVRRMSSSEMRVLYHGSIVPARLPLAVIDAIARLPDAVRLIVVGYETPGHVGYIDELRRRARAQQVDGRVDFRGPLSRAELMRHCATCDVGLALLPLRPSDVNERAMIGASNKVFDYMAAGLAVVVPDAREWRDAYVDTGFGVGCDPESATSVAAALNRLLSNPEERMAMGERGRQKIAEEWNYERAFAPILARISATALNATHPVLA
jgi:glycosyltransferase involved in cell wall biosynthesis